MIPKCHRLLIGFEEAEAQAKRESSLGWDVGVLDPGVTPEDYHWDIDGDDVLAFAVGPINKAYIESLGLALMARGGRHIAIFDHEGDCQFGRFLAMRGEEGGK